MPNTSPKRQRGSLSNPCHAPVAEVVRLQSVDARSLATSATRRKPSLALRASFVFLLVSIISVAYAEESPPPAAKSEPAVVPDSRQVGGEPDGVVQVANLIYAGIKSSHCFSDHFLVDAEKDSAISTSRRFHAVKLAGAEIYSFPLLIMTGEGDFTLPSAEREALRRYVERGGFLLASASCSSVEWDRAFRREMAAVFTEQPLQSLGMDHPIFHTVYEIPELQSKHGTPKPLEAITLGGRVAVIYSQDGLNDTAHTQGCCCCGGNEILNCIQVNVNILAYALTY